MAFPATLDDSSSLPNPIGTNTQNSPDHAALHSSENAAIIALEAKLGTGASTPVVSRLLFGTGTGTSAWTQLTSAQLSASLTDETGTGSAVFATTPTLVTPKVDTINESTPANGVTIDGVLLKDNKMNGSYITDGTVANAQVATGAVVQVVNTQTGTLATGTTTIPIDNTIPQNTEGDQYMTLAITPKSATNLLLISSTAYYDHTVQTNVIMALFQDSTANALATAVHRDIAANFAVNTLTHKMTAGTTSSTTFKIRMGGSNAGTLTFNGVASTAYMGGTLASNITITEIKV